MLIVRSTTSRLKPTGCASRRMDARHRLAAILRDAPIQVERTWMGAPQDEVRTFAGFDSSCAPCADKLGYDDGWPNGSALEPGRHVLVLAGERHAGSQRHGLHQ